MPESTTSSPTGEAAAGSSSELRSFFWGLEAEPAASDGPWTPPVLAPYLARNTRSPDPFVLAPPPDPSAADPTASDTRRARCRLLPDLLDDLVDEGAPAVLRDNLIRLERHVRRAGNGSLVAAFESASGRLREELDLPEAESGQLGAGLEDLGDRIRRIWGPEARLTSVDDDTAPGILCRALRARRERALRVLRAEALELREGLRALLDAHGPATESRGALGGLGGRFLKDDALSTLPRTRRAPLGDDRAARIGAALADLEALESAAPTVVLLAPSKEIGGLGEAELEGLEIHTVDDPVAASREAFDEAADELMPAFRALRTARLELAGAFDPHRHPQWLAALDVRALEANETSALPAVAFLLDEEEWTRELGRIGALLRSRRPIVAIVRRDPFPRLGDDGSAGRIEPASLGLGMREILVLQAAAGVPDHLVAGAERVASSCRPSLVVVPRPEARDGVPRWLAEAAAVDARAHPLFLFDPDAGTSWANRFELGPVPNPSLDWVRPPLPGGAEGETAAFTVGDLALLGSAASGGLRPAPEDFDGDLLPLDQWLDLDPEEAGLRLPFVPGARSDGSTVRLVADHRLTTAVRDQLDHWRSLRELAGIRNVHVERAVARTREEDRQALDDRIAALEERHAEELRTVQERAVDEAVERVLGALLEESRGHDSVATSPHRERQAPPTAPASDEEPDVETLAEEAPAPEPAPSTAADAGPVEPWIDSELCTSCGDCLARSGQLFAYDENKRAYIKDPRGGTYAEIVEAAEACPARVIHPGTPLDPSEPDLETWVARAEPFN